MASPANGTNYHNKWAAFGFTTTPEERIGPGPPYTHPALQVNLFFRVFLGFLSLFVTWVPARLLWRNGEFAGTVMCVTLLIINGMTLINALIWRNDNVETWWAGYGWCDFQAYFQFGLHTAFNVSMFDIMRSLAGKVALNRAVTPTPRERRRQRIVSALVIFTFPVIQVLLTYFATIGRYNVSTLAGCSPVYYPNWLYLVFYILPTPAYAVGAGIMAAVTFYRYRKIDRVTRDVTRSQDGIAAARQDRIRKKLYFMTLFCIIVFMPMVLILLIKYIIEGAPWNLPYDFNRLHFGPDPFNVHFISFTTSDLMDFTALALNFIALLAGLIVFIPFGSTPEALNMYRELLLAVGLGYIFPKLREEYVPRAKRPSTWSWSSLTRPLRGKSSLATSSTTSTRKESLLPTAEQVSLASRGERTLHSSSAAAQPRDFTMDMEAVPFPEKTTTAAFGVVPHNPWPDLSAAEIDIATAQIEAGPPPPARNPFPFPTPATKPPVRFPAISIPIPSRKQQHTKTNDDDHHRHYRPAPEIPHFSTPSKAKTQHTWSPLTTTANPSPRPRPDTNLHVGAGVVDTRVWAASEPDPQPGPSSGAGGAGRGATPGGATPREAGPRSAGVGGGAAGVGVVRVETSIARRSMDAGAPQQQQHQQLYQHQHPYRHQQQQQQVGEEEGLAAVRGGRASSAAS